MDPQMPDTVADRSADWTRSDHPVLLAGCEGEEPRKKRPRGKKPEAGGSTDPEPAPEPETTPP